MTIVEKCPTLQEQSFYSCISQSCFWLEFFYILQGAVKLSYTFNVLLKQWVEAKEGFFSYSSDDPGFTLKPEDEKDPH